MISSGIEGLGGGLPPENPYVNAGIRDAQKAVEFYKRAFGAEALSVHRMPDGKVMHAELKIGDSRLMLNDEFPEMKAVSPQSLGGSPVTLHIYVKDVDSLFNQAVAAGAKASSVAGGPSAPG